MNAKNRQKEQILMHGFRLIRAFKLTDSTSPVDLCKAVHRIETKLDRLHTDECNGVMQDEKKSERIEMSAMKRLDALLNFRAQNLPVFINGDPRGHALKVKSEFDIDLPRDMGGHGIICPEFNGN